jgi:hypothetical protein
MNRAQQLAHRRESLRLRAAAQRAELAHAVGPIKQKLSRVDRTIDTIRRIGTRPWVLGGIAVVLALVGPGRLLRWGTRGLLAADTARRLLKAWR